MPPQRASHLLSGGSIELAEYRSREPPDTVFERRFAAIPAFPIGGKAAFRDAAADFERVRVRERLPGGTVGSRVEPPKVPDLSADRAVIQIRIERALP